VSHTRAVWDEGREPGRAVVALGVAVALTVIVVNVAMVGRVSMFFDLCFVLLCLGLALLVRPRDFFTVGVLPPLIMVVGFAILAIDRPGAIASPRDGLVQAVISGLAHHSVALVCGYALCLVTLLARQRAAR
jgi:hypothetical protein